VFISNLIRRQRARRTYFKTSATAGDINAALYTTYDPAARADMLDQVAAMEDRMAAIHATAWGPDPNPDENGRDVAESTASSAVLLRMLAATERTAVDPTEGFRCVFWSLGADGFEQDLWVKLANTRDRGMRAHLIDQLADYATDRVGGQAAEALACQMHAERELANAELQDRAPVAPKDHMRLIQNVAFGVLVTWAALTLIPYFH
jgi:hypothetical protein